MLPLILTRKNHSQFESLDVPGFGFIIELEIFFAAALLQCAQLSMGIVDL